MTDAEEYIHEKIEKSEQSKLMGVVWIGIFIASGIFWAAIFYFISLVW